MPSPQRITAQRARRRRRQLGAGAVAAVAIVALGAGVAVAMSGSSGPTYRLASVASGGVAQTLSAVGTLAPVHQASPSFPVAGVVQNVFVVVGQRVTAGQRLATLNTTSLQQQVTSDTAAVAGAQQSLANDEASQTATTATSGASGSTTGTGSASGTGSTAGSGPSAATKVAAAVPQGGTATGGKTLSGARAGSAPLLAAVTRAQQALLNAQRALDSDLSNAEQALQTCRTDLSGAGQQTSSTAPTTTSPTTVSSSAAPTATPSASATNSATSTATAPPTPAPPSTGSGTSSAGGNPPTGIAGCLAAISAAPSQGQTGRDKQGLMAAESALDKAIVALAKSAAGGTTGSTSAAGGTTGSTSAAGGTTGSTTTGSKSTTGSSATGSTAGSSATGSSARTAGVTSAAGSGGKATGPASAEQLASDQAQIDAANASLAVARQNVDETTLTSPIAGTVAAVSLTAGGSVGASSTSSDIAIIGPGQTEVSLAVPLVSIASVKIGQSASVAVDGLANPVGGKVSSIGILSSTTGSTTTYPVTVILDATNEHLVDGAGAAVSIDVAAVAHVLTIPTSAVHILGSSGTVTVYRKGKTTLTRVTLGAVGVDRAQVLSGLTAGEQVVLATLGTPLPSATTNSNLTRRLGVTGAGGGALGTGGGLTGGGLTGTTGRSTGTGNRSGTGG